MPADFTNSFPGLKRRESFQTPARRNRRLITNMILPVSLILPSREVHVAILPVVENAKEKYETEKIY